MTRKRNYLFILIASLLPLGITSGQQKGNTEKVKVIISDDQGNRSVIDTTFTGNMDQGDTIMLKNGRVIFIGDNQYNEKIISMPGSKSIYLSSGNGKDTKDKIREITVIKSDTLKISGDVGNGESKIYVFSSHDDEEPVKHYEIIRHSSNEGNTSGNKYIYIDEGDGLTWNGGSNFSIINDTLQSDDDMGSTKHVIAKNGIVVSVEGKDEAHVRDLLEEINKKLDTFKSEPSKESTGKRPGLK